MSPQICQGEEYDGKLADVWALGATMYMLRFGRPPFLAKKVIELCYKIVHNDVEWPPIVVETTTQVDDATTTTTTTTTRCDPQVQGLLAGMLQKEPKRRLPLQQVYRKATPIIRSLYAARAPPRPTGTTPIGDGNAAGTLTSPGGGAGSTGGDGRSGGRGKGGGKGAGRGAWLNNKARGITHSTNSSSSSGSNSNNNGSSSSSSSSSNGSRSRPCSRRCAS